MTDGPSRHGERPVDFRAIAELGFDLAFRLDTGGSFTYVSPSVERFFGRSVDETLGSHFSEVVAPDSEPVAARAFQRLLDGETVAELELGLLDETGEVRRTVVNVEPIREDGAVVGARGVAEDVTDRVRREERLAAQRDRLERIDRINDTLRGVQRAIVDAETEREVTERVCERLVDSEFYAAVWYGEPTDGSLTPAVGAGPESYFEAATVDLASPALGGSLRAPLERGEVPVLRDADPGPDAASVLEDEAPDAAAVAMVPVSREDDLGVLSLLATRPDAFDGRERAVLANLGEAIGDALAGAAARRDARLLRRVIDRSEDAMFVVDPADGRVVNANGGACRQLGYDREQLLGMHVWAFSANVEPEEWNRWAERVRGEPRSFEGTHVTADGTEVPVDLRTERVSVEDRDYIVAHARDLSTERELRNRIAERTRELRTILENAPVLVFRVDPDGSFTRWEGRGLDRLPVDGERLESLTLESVRSEAAAENCRRALDGTPVRDTVEFGGRHWETWYQPVHEGGEVAGVIGFGLDVTEDRRRNQVVEVLNRVLRHNLRNVMNVVIGEAARMQVEADDPSAAEAGGRIEEAGADLLELADAARDIRRVVMDDREFGPIDPVPAVRSVADRLAEGYPNATVSVDAAVDGAPRVPDTGLEIAVRELVDNALEHGGPAATVSVTLSATADAVRLRVADDGPGLPEMERAVLQEGGEAPLRHGQGLGLWLVNWVVSEAGGDLDIDADDGTTVTLSLPRADARPAEQATGAADADD